jgi:hypothetical protein
MARATHTTVDGSTVTFDGPVDLTAAVTSSVRYDDATIVRELTTAPVTAMDALPYVVDEEYAHRGGTLRIGHRDEADATIGSRRRDTFAVWQGAVHALLLVEAEAGADVLIAVLDRLTLTESPTGLAVEADGLVPATTRLVKEIPGVGLAEVSPLVPEVAQGLPRWAGTEVTGGELYRDEARPGAPVLVLVGDTASTTLLLDGGGPEADEATTRAAELIVTWTAPH